MKKNSSQAEHRKFIRLDSVFPVKFQLLEDAKAVGCHEHHGFTSNISKGGLCLEIPRADSDTVALLKNNKEIKLNLKIHIPIHLPAITVVAKVSWFQEEESHLSQYLVGLRYEKIAPKDVKRIMRVAYSKVILPRVMLAGIIILFFAFALSAYNNIKLSFANKKLIEEMVSTAKEARLNRDEVEKIKEKRLDLETKFAQANELIKTQTQTLNNRIEELQRIEQDNQEELKKKELEVEKLKSILIALEQDKTGLAGKIGDLTKKEEAAVAKLN